MHRPTEPESALRSPAGRYSSCNVNIRRRANSASAFSPNIGARSERDQLSHPRSSADVWCNWLAEGGLRPSAVGALGLEEKLGGIISSAARKRHGHTTTTQQSAKIVTTTTIAANDAGDDRGRGDGGRRNQECCANGNKLSDFHVQRG